MNWATTQSLPSVWAESSLADVQNSGEKEMDWARFLHLGNEIEIY